MTVTMITLLITIFLATTASSTTTRPFTAIYAFGDSTVDPGNNDYIPTALFRANHEPYGINFPNRVPTGRFSDGLLTPDFLAKYLGLKNNIPAFSNPFVTDTDLLTGASFASAGSGLDELTIKVSKAINLTAQVNIFEQAIRMMKRSVGPNKTGPIIENALFLISVGSNDMLLYFDLPTRAIMYNPSSFSDFLISRLQSIIQSLYKLGGRRFAVIGLPPLGCLPIQARSRRACVDQQNAHTQIYNDKLQYFLKQLRSQHSDARFAYADLYNPMMDMINNPRKHGFEVTLEGCCGTGTLESGELCCEATPLCDNPSTYIFWDSIHPTQATYHIIAKALETNVLPTLLH